MHITFYDVIHIFDIHLMGWKYLISNKHNEYPHVHRIRSLQNEDPISWSFAKNFALWLVYYIRNT